jgi:hypothetical protein
VFLAAVSAVALAAPFQFLSASSAPRRRPRQATPPTPCSVKGIGSDIVLVGKTIKLTFKGDPGGGNISVKPPPQTLVSTNTVTTGDTAEVTVTGKKQSVNVGDVKLQVTYKCPDGKSVSLAWVMTVIPETNNTLTCQVVPFKVGLPAGPGSVSVGGNDTFDFRVFSAGLEPPATFIDPKWVVLGDDGDPSGTDRGDVNATTPGGLPKTITNLPVDVTGLQASIFEGDVMVFTKVHCGEPAGNPIAGFGRRQYTVGTAPDCGWLVSGAPQQVVEGLNGTKLPLKSAKTTQTIYFIEVPSQSADLTWDKKVTLHAVKASDPGQGTLIDPPSWIKVEGIVEDNGNRLKVTITVDGKDGPVGSSTKNDFVIEASYGCKHSSGIKKAGSATHQLSVYNLLVP